MRLFNLAVGLTSLKDWLKKQPSEPFTPQDVEEYWKSVALSSFRDREECRKAPRHHEVRSYNERRTSSAWTEPLTRIETLAKALKLGKKYPRLKIVCTDRSRHRAVDLGQTAISECQKFLKDHGVV